VMHFAGVSLAAAVAMATEHPARLLGIEPGHVTPGEPADLVVFDLVDKPADTAFQQFRVRTVLIAGEVDFGSL
jgi:N-acetylglucosamine-6-phosphate deacetylase